MPFSTMPIYRSSSAVTALFFGLAAAPVFASPLSNSVLENSRVRRNPPPPPPTLAPTVSSWSKIELPYATDDLVTDIWGNSGWTKAGVEDFYDNVYGEIIDNANTAQSKCGHPLLIIPRWRIAFCYHGCPPHGTSCQSYFESSVPQRIDASFLPS